MKSLFNGVGRGGSKADDRPEAAVQKLLEASDTVGFEQGEPIASVGYDDYPTETYATKELFLPQSADILREIAESDAVHDRADLCKELGFKEENSTVERACEIHGIDLPEYDESKEAPEIDLVDSDGDEFTVNTEIHPKDGFILLYHLYVTLGLSTQEISQVVDRKPKSVLRDLQRLNIE